ncbi:hypothetical protein A3762_19910 [Oleiphilus sp. HI0125]|nr:hypothetical protein A3762_19910 [Oleiphilus sp. HI0125]
MWLNNPVNWSLNNWKKNTIATAAPIYIQVVGPAPSIDIEVPPVTKLRPSKGKDTIKVMIAVNTA